MKKKFILFISSNASWGGSEVLWTMTAQRLLLQFDVKVATYYDHPQLERCIKSPQDRIDLTQRFRYPNLLVKGINRLFGAEPTPSDELGEWMKKKPALVVISQGNNLIGKSFMQVCIDYGIPYVTVTQLVTESVWLTINDKIYEELVKTYENSSANYFVSLHAKRLHEKMIRTSINNNKIIYNPFSKHKTDDFSYPIPEKGIYKIAVVGRLEIFHKGYDILIDIFKQPKWKSRPVTVSIFGNGIHNNILKSWLKTEQIDNIHIHDHIENVADIWKEHHLLLMPSRMEGQSLSLIEAMHFERPAVVTRVGGIEELIEEGITGFIAEYPSVASVDEALEKAWAQRDQWEPMGKTANRYIQERHPVNAADYFMTELTNLIK